MRFVSLIHTLLPQERNLVAAGYDGSNYHESVYAPTLADRSVMAM